jgi:CRISPR system Cascade subunit CasD
MPSVIMVLSGVLQSWGTTTIGHARSTMSYPTKSAVIGLVANAMGRDRSDDISDLADMSYGVRVDSVGKIQRDYHTVSIITQPTKGDRVNRITERYYLADAEFVVALYSDSEALVNVVAQALKKPKRALFLGRKSCPPNKPLFHSVVADDVRGALLSFPMPKTDESTISLFRDPINEDEGYLSDVVMDNPVTFDSAARRYAPRGVFHERINVGHETDAVPLVHSNPAMTFAMSVAEGDK